MCADRVLGREGNFAVNINSITDDKFMNEAKRFSMLQCNLTRRTAKGKRHFNFERVSFSLIRSSLRSLFPDGCWSIQIHLFVGRTILSHMYFKFRCERIGVESLLGIFVVEGKKGKGKVKRIFDSRGNDWLSELTNENKSAEIILFLTIKKSVKSPTIALSTLWCVNDEVKTLFFD